jgi:DNA mismatch repair ATPase MutL
MTTTCECGSVVKNITQHFNTEKHRNWIVKQGGTISIQTKHTCECGSVVTRLAPHYKTKRHLAWVERQTKQELRAQELRDREQRTHEFNLVLELLRSQERARKLRNDARKQKEKQREEREEQRKKQRQERENQRKKERENQRKKEREKERENQRKKERENQRKKERENQRENQRKKERENRREQGSLLFRSSNPFIILGIPSTSTKGQIRKAYYNLAKIHHPDKGGNPEIFKKVNNAYSSIK